MIWLRMSLGTFTLLPLLDSWILHHHFQHQSLKKNTFRVKSSTSMFFCFFLSFSYRQLTFLSLLCRNYFFNSLVNIKIKSLRWNLITPTQHYFVWIRLQRKIYFVTSFTFSRWLKSTIFYLESFFLKENSSFYWYDIFFYM